MTALRTRGIDHRTAAAIAASIAAAAAASAGADVPAITDEYTVDYAQGVYDRFYETGEYGEAVSAGKLVLDLLLSQPEPDQTARADALAQLAAAQRLAGDYEPAITNYTAAVDALIAATDRLNAALIDPLLGLGRAYRDAGNLPAAVGAFEQTLHVQQVNFGLHGLEQSELLLELSELHYAMGDLSTADSLQEANVNLVNRNFPGDDVRRVPAMYSRAEMLRRIGNNVDSQKVYRRAIGIVERAEGTKTLTLLEPMFALSEVFLYNQIEDGFHGPTQARRYLQRAVWIVEHNDAATAEQKAEAYVRMADFMFLKTNDRFTAHRYYRQAWDVLSDDPSLTAARDRYFASPVPLNDVRDNWLPAYEILRTRSIPGMADNGVVVVRYDTDVEGHADNFRIAESRPSDTEGAIVVGQLKRLLFRPVFADGEPVASTDNEFEIRFQYVPDDQPATPRTVAGGGGEPDDAIP